MDSLPLDFAVVYTGAVSLSASDVSTYDVAVRCYDPYGQVIKVLKVGIVRNTAPVFTQCNSNCEFIPQFFINISSR